MKVYSREELKAIVTDFGVSFKTDDPSVIDRWAGKPNLNLKKFLVPRGELKSKVPNDGTQGISLARLAMFYNAPKCLSKLLQTVDVDLDRLVKNYPSAVTCDDTKEVLVNTRTAEYLLDQYESSDAIRDVIRQARAGEIRKVIPVKNVVQVNRDEKRMALHQLFSLLDTHPERLTSEYRQQIESLNAELLSLESVYYQRQDAQKTANELFEALQKSTSELLDRQQACVTEISQLDEGIKDREKRCALLDEQLRQTTMALETAHQDTLAKLKAQNSISYVPIIQVRESESYLSPLESPILAQLTSSLTDQISQMIARHNTPYLSRDGFPHPKLQIHASIVDPSLQSRQLFKSSVFRFDLRIKMAADSAVGSHDQEIFISELIASRQGYLKIQKCRKALLELDTFLKEFIAQANHSPLAVESLTAISDLPEFLEYKASEPRSSIASKNNSQNYIRYDSPSSANTPLISAPTYYLPNPSVNHVEQTDKTPLLLKPTQFQPSSSQALPPKKMQLTPLFSG